MNAESRIERMGKDTVKAALLYLVREDAKVAKEMDEFTTGFGATRTPIEVWENRVLNEALKGGRHGEHKGIG